jgi:hypothetical protein
MELQKKTGRYLLYAIGEIVLVVVGILIALSINNWNEGRKDQQRRSELIENLKRDSILNLQRIDEALERADLIMGGYERFLEAAGSLTTDASIEEMQQSIDNGFRALMFQPVSGSLDSARSTGDIALIVDSTLINLFTEIESLLTVFNDLARVNRDLHFQGPRVELRKKLGSVRGTLDIDELFNPPRFAISDEEFWEVVTDKEVYGVIESFHQVRWGQQNMLNSLRELTEEILARLEEI